LLRASVCIGAVEAPGGSADRPEGSTFAKNAELASVRIDESAGDCAGTRIGGVEVLVRGIFENADRRGPGSIERLRRKRSEITAAGGDVILRYHAAGGVEPRGLGVGDVEILGAAVGGEGGHAGCAGDIWIGAAGDGRKQTIGSLGEDEDLVGAVVEDVDIVAGSAGGDDADIGSAGDGLSAARNLDELAGSRSGVGVNDLGIASGRVAGFRGVKVWGRSRRGNR